MRPLPPGFASIATFAFLAMVNNVPADWNWSGFSLAVGVALADAFGTATLPLPLLYPVGAGPLQNQNFTFCTSDPLGLVFAPMQTIYAAGF